MRKIKRNLKLYRTREGKSSFRMQNKNINIWIILRIDRLLWTIEKKQWTFIAQIITFEHKNTWKHYFPCRNIDMAQTGTGLGELCNGIKRQTKFGPSVTVRFVNQARPKRGLTFLCKLAPGLEILTRVVFRFFQLSIYQNC